MTDLPFESLVTGIRRQEYYGGRLQLKSTDHTGAYDDRQSSTALQWRAFEGGEVTIHLSVQELADLYLATRTHLKTIIDRGITHPWDQEWEDRMEALRELGLDEDQPLENWALNQTRPCKKCGDSDCKFSACRGDY